MSKKKHNWAKIKKEYISRNIILDGDKEISLQDLAKKHNISPQVLWNRSRKEEWKQELEDARNKKVEALALQPQEAAILVDEDEVRSENFKTTNDLLKNVIEVWEENNKDNSLPEKLKPNEFLNMATTLVRMRQYSTSFSDISILDMKDSVTLHRGEVSVAESTETQSRYKKVAGDLSDYIKKKQMSEEL
jgi:hypothetical protein